MYIQNLIALAYLLVAAIPALYLIRPLAVAHMGLETFVRRRNVWLSVTILLFVAPNFWVYAVGLVIITIQASKKENNPIALYALLLVAAPPKLVELPEMLGIRLIPISGLTILTATILIPAYWRRRRNSSPTSKNDPYAVAVTYLVLAFCAAQLLTSIPNVTLTVTIRRAVELALNTICIFVICNRLIPSKEVLKDVLQCLTIAFFLAASIGVVEGLISWLLYVQVGDQWAASALGNYILRQDGLRVTSSADSPITLGHLASLCIVGLLIMYEGIASNRKYKIYMLTAIGICAVAIYFTRSRAPLITAPICIIIYMAARPHFAKRITQLFLPVVIGGGLLFITPIGAKVIDILPFIGTVATDAVDYRTAMNAALWNLFLHSPIYGNPNLIADLSYMKQGQGLVDPLNVYLTNAAAFGIGGVIPLLLTLLIALQGVLKHGRIARNQNNTELNLLNAGILGMTIAHAVFMYTMSFMQTVESVHWVLLAMATSVGSAAQRIERIKTYYA